MLDFSCRQKTANYLVSSRILALILFLDPDLFVLSIDMFFIETTMLVLCNLRWMRASAKCCEYKCINEPSSKVCWFSALLNTYLDANRAATEGPFISAELTKQRYENPRRQESMSQHWAASQDRTQCSLCVLLPSSLKPGQLEFYLYNYYYY